MIELEKMSLENKIVLMEALWEEFSTKQLEEYLTPSWHKEVLEERKDAKEEEFLTLKDAKERLYSCIK